MTPSAEALPVPEARAASPYYTEEHEAFRHQVRRFVEKEIAPHVDAWDEAGTFPRELYRKAAEVGLLQLGFPEEYGGVATDVFFGIVKSEELSRAGSGGVNASLMSHTIGAPPIAALGPEWMKRKLLPEILSGEKISALAITEPSGGSDVANLRYYVATRVQEVGLECLNRAYGGRDEVFATHRDPRRRSGVCHAVRGV